MKYRVTASVDVEFDVDGEDALADLVDKLRALPEVRTVRKIQRVITEEIVDGVGANS